MEAVPRLPMLSVELKVNSAIDDSTEFKVGVESLHESIKSEINKHISHVYGDDPKKYQDCISKFLSLQESAYHAMSSPDFEGCNTVKKYYGQLHFMQSRFPFTGDNYLDVAFNWCDAFNGNLTQHSSFAFEQSAVIFNLGASHSYLGAIDNRTSDDGTKVSCVHFQCAAGFFQFLLDKLDTTLASDTSQFMLKLFINAMLGQAQECLLEKSMQDNRTNSIVSKISQQVVDYFKASLRSLQNAEAKVVMGESANKFWCRLISFKIAFYSAITMYYQGCACWDSEQYGEGVSFMGKALELYNESVKLGKQFKGEVKTKIDATLKYSADVFGGKYNSVKHDNDFIYHEKVPDKDTLSAVRPASLVKPLPFDPSNPSIAGPDLFAKLVPLEAHLAASSYSEEKAKLLRQIMEEVNEKDSILTQYKESIELNPAQLINVEQEDTLDEVIIEHCALLSVDQSTITTLSNSMKEFSDIFMDIDTSLSDIDDIITGEENEAKQVEDVCGKTIKSPERFSKFKAEVGVCRDVHTKAGAMNDDLHTAMRVHINNLKIVSTGIDAVKAECNFKSILQLIDTDDVSAVEVMRKLCLKVKEMEEQRVNLIAELRTQLEQDDVTSTLMTRPGVDAEDVFADEIKKHDAYLGYIRQNLSAQDNILTAVTEANVNYARVKKIVEAHQSKYELKPLTEILHE